MTKSFKPLKPSKSRAVQTAVALPPSTNASIASLTAVVEFCKTNVPTPQKNAEIKDPELPVFQCVQNPL